MIHGSRLILPVVGAIAAFKSSSWSHKFVYLLGIPKKNVNYVSKRGSSERNERCVLSTRFVDQHRYLGVLSYLWHNDVVNASCGHDG